MITKKDTKKETFLGYAIICSVALGFALTI